MELCNCFFWNSMLLINLVLYHVVFLTGSETSNTGNAIYLESTGQDINIPQCCTDDNNLKDNGGQWPRQLWYNNAELNWSVNSHPALRNRSFDISLWFGRDIGCRWLPWLPPPACQVAGFGGGDVLSDFLKIHTVLFYLHRNIWMRECML